MGLTYAESLPFPAVTICNLNPYKRSKVNNSQSLQNLITAYNYVTGKKIQQAQNNITSTRTTIEPTTQEMHIRKKRAACTAGTFNSTVIPPGYSQPQVYSVVCTGGPLLQFTTCDGSGAIVTSRSIPAANWNSTMQTQMEQAFYLCLMPAWCSGGCGSWPDALSILTGMTKCIQNNNISSPYPTSGSSTQNIPTFANAVAEGVADNCSLLASTCNLWIFTKPNNPKYPGNWWSQECCSGGTYNYTGTLNGCKNYTATLAERVIIAEDDSLCGTSLAACNGTNGACPYSWNPGCNGNEYQNFVCSILNCNQTRTTTIMHTTTGFVTTTEPTTKDDSTTDPTSTILSSTLATTTVAPTTTTLSSTTTIEATIATSTMSSMTPTTITTTLSSTTLSTTTASPTSTTSSSSSTASSSSTSTSTASTVSTSTASTGSSTSTSSSTTTPTTTSNASTSALSSSTSTSTSITSTTVTGSTTSSTATTASSSSISTPSSTITSTTSTSSSTSATSTTSTASSTISTPTQVLSTSTTSVMTQTSSTTTNGATATSTTKTTSTTPVVSSSYQSPGTTNSLATSTTHMTSPTILTTTPTPTTTPLKNTVSSSSSTNISSTNQSTAATALSSTTMPLAVAVTSESTTTTATKNSALSSSAATISPQPTSTALGVTTASINTNQVFSTQRTPSTTSQYVANSGISSTDSEAGISSPNPNDSLAFNSGATKISTFDVTESLDSRRPDTKNDLLTTNLAALTNIGNGVSSRTTTMFGQDQELTTDSENSVQPKTSSNLYTEADKFGQITSTNQQRSTRISDPFVDSYSTLAGNTANGFVNTSLWQERDVTTISSNKNSASSNGSPIPSQTTTNSNSNGKTAHSSFDPEDGLFTSTHPQTHSNENDGTTDIFENASSTNENGKSQFGMLTTSQNTRELAHSRNSSDFVTSSPRFSSDQIFGGSTNFSRNMNFSYTSSTLIFFEWSTSSFGKNVNTSINTSSTYGIGVTINPNQNKTNQGSTSFPITTTSATDYSLTNLDFAITCPLCFNISNLTQAQTAQLDQLSSLYGLNPDNSQVTIDVNFQEALNYVSASMTDLERQECGYSLTDLVQSCVIAGNPCNLTEDFALTFDVDYGNCYTFNYRYPDIKYNTTRSGAPNGLRMLVMSEVSDYLTSTSEAGIKITLHPQDCYPYPNVEGYKAVYAHVFKTNLLQIALAQMQGYPFPVTQMCHFVHI
uniref:Uncharacterized protein n=1 Tax=Acrobeloides nanus TaxID=290746 RepID=A0A914DU34_9BILA